MPSLRKRVSSYFRQLSFHNEPRDKRHNINENSFVTKYLQGHVTLREGPPIIYGKNPTDLPNYELGEYETGPSSVVGCYTGPKGGLTTVKRAEKHLSVPDPDIDFIDTAEESGGDAPGDASSYATPPDDSALPSEWTQKSDLVFGISDSLYDRNQVTDNKNGDPIADCFGIIARENSAILAVADGVNWGEKACIAAKSAVHGSLHYLNKTIFNDTKPFERLTIKPEETSDASAACTRVGNTREIFVCLLRAFSCAHDLILENKGMLTTLTVAVVVPLKRRDSTQRYVCCVCNVGDTLAYVYSQRYGLRELTKGSHDINCNRDMRDALGALGPVDGINPELSNLTLSITTLNKGDLVMVASDGLTDNFDPNVCRFTVNSRLGEAGKVGRSEPPVKPPRRSVPPRRPPAQVTDNKTSSLRKQISSQNKEGQKFSRSKTTIEVRPGGGVRHHVARNEEGIPYVTPLQRYELQLLLIEDVLRHGISGRDDPCTTARKLCESLVSFTFSITSAKRHTLEDQDLYFDNQNGVLVEVSQQEKKIRRKKGLEKVQNLPGKLDHVTVVAWNVGNFTQTCN